MHTWTHSYKTSISLFNGDSEHQFFPSRDRETSVSWASCHPSAELAWGGQVSAAFTAQVLMGNGFPRLGNGHSRTIFLYYLLTSPNYQTNHLHLSCSWRFNQHSWWGLSFINNQLLIAPTWRVTGGKRNASVFAWSGREETDCTGKMRWPKTRMNSTNPNYINF